MAAYSLSQLAEEDVRRLYRHSIETFGLQQADAYFDGLFERFEAIAENPAMYPRVDDIRAGYRRSVYGVHSIYYTVTESGVAIMRVLGRENPSALD